MCDVLALVTFNPATTNVACMGTNLTNSCDQTLLFSTATFSVGVCTVVDLCMCTATLAGVLGAAVVLGPVIGGVLGPVTSALGPLANAAGLSPPAGPQSFSNLPETPSNDIPDIPDSGPDDISDASLSRMFPDTPGGADASCKSSSAPP